MERLTRTTLFLAFIAACGDNRATVLSGDGDPSEVALHEVTTPSSIEFGYDPMGQLTSASENGARTTVEYDALGTPRTVTDALDGGTTTDFSAAGLLTAHLDARRIATRYTRDGFGDVTGISSADIGVVQKRYDEAGNLTELVDARGVHSTLTYDALNRLTSATHQPPTGPASLFTWTWDEAGAVGKVTSTTFPGGASQRSYDAIGALVRATQQVGSVSTITSFEYDQGQLVRLRYPSGRQLNIERHEGEPTALRLGEDGGVLVADELERRGRMLQRLRWHLTAGPRVQERTFDSSGRITRHPLGNGTRVLEYDDSGRVVAFRHEANGAPAAGLDAVANASDETFRYDALDRLAGYTTSASSFAVDWDATHNRLSLRGPGLTKNATIDPASNHTSVSFDDAGNLISDGVLTATYDAAGRLETVTRGGISLTSLYDGANFRVRKTSPLNDLVFVWDPQGHLLGEYDASGAAVREYLWLGDHLVGFFLRDEFFYVQLDHLGAPRVAIDLAGRVRWTWLAHPFGDRPAAQPAGSLGLSALPLRFPGQYDDEETGLFSNHHRHYDPETGRYLEPDPLGLEDGPNPYVYVAGNPVNAIDPTGLAKLNFFRRGDPQHRAAEEDPDVPGILSVSGHGDRNAMYDQRSGEDEKLGAEALAQRIRDSGLWKPGMFVRLLACNVGRGGKDSLVWKLSRALNTPVSGPDSLILDLPQRSGGGWYPSNTWTPDDMPGPAGRFITAVPSRARPSAERPPAPREAGRCPDCD